MAEESLLRSKNIYGTLSENTNKLNKSTSLKRSDSTNSTLSANKTV